MTPHRPGDSRWRRGFVLGTAACAGLIAAGLAATAPTTARAEPQPETLAPEVADAPQTASRAALPPKPRARPRLEQAVVQIERGDTLASALGRAGIDAGDAYRAAHKLDRVAEVGDLRPGQRVRLRLGGEPGEPVLKRLRLHASAERTAIVERTESGGFTAEAEARELTTRTHGVTGTIRQSLFAAGRRHQVPPKVMLTVIHKLSYRVDFQRDLREGARFELVYDTQVTPAGNRAAVGLLRYAAVERDGETLEMYRFDDGSPTDSYYTQDGKSVRRLLMRTPLNGARISSGFGMRKHPISGYTKMHEGVDFGAPRGTPIYAAGKGVVRRAEWNGGYGRYVEIAHPGPFRTAYGHMARFADGVEPGTRVTQGEIVGYVGNSGRSTGPHLHYEIQKHGEAVNPRDLDLPTGHTLSGEARERFEARVAEIDRLRDELTGETRVAQACERGDGC